MNLKSIGANQTEVNVKQCVVLFSYETPVAYLYNGHAYITDVFYSRTTSKHISAFLSRHGFPKDGISTAQSRINELVA